MIDNVLGALFITVLWIDGKDQPKDDWHLKHYVSAVCHFEVGGVGWR